MEDYISREAALKVIALSKPALHEMLKEENISTDNLSNTGQACYDGMISAIDMCYKLISEAVTTADVRLVRYGKWLIDHNYRDIEGVICSVFKCSCCEGKQNDYTPPFCPECGAIMRDRIQSNDRPEI